MTGSGLAVGMIVLAGVAGLIAMLVPVLAAANRPYFRHPRPDHVPGKVRGGIHLGDPRSQGPPQGEEARQPPRQQAPAPTAEAAGPTEHPQNSGGAARAP